jgi:adenylate cyclase class 2
MATETEAKMKVDDLDAIRAKLRELGATRVGKRFETNQFFDSPDRALKSKDQGLRLRSMKHEDGSETNVITFKGPAIASKVKSREEIEFSIGSFDDAAALLGKLGYSPTLGFEKRRETFELDGCLVELDELPHLGTFVEIEGESESLVLATRAKLGMDTLSLISQGYIRMIDELVKQHPELGPTVRFR